MVAPAPPAARAVVIVVGIHISPAIEAWATTEGTAVKMTTTVKMSTAAAAYLLDEARVRG
jgi:hypothetical protein